MTLKQGIDNQSPERVRAFLTELQGAFTPDGDVPKARQIKNLIKASISDGLLRPDDRIPTAEAISNALGVTRFTVDNAISGLVREGMVRRSQGKGTFVLMDSPRITMQEAVGIIMPTEGHLWNSLVGIFARGLSKHELYCMFVDFSLSGDSPPSKKLVAHLKRIIDSKPAHLVIRGVSRFPFELVKNYDGQLIFADCFETDERIVANYALVDYHHVGKLVGNHLRSLGHRTIIFDAPKLEPRHKLGLEVLAGLRDAFTDQEESEENILLTHGDLAVAEQLLTSVDRPTAIFCLEDFRAKAFYDIANRLKIIIPKDLSIVGVFDTPWCQILQPNLTSVSINERQMAESIVRTVSEGHQHSRILVEPSLVIRDSCAAVPAS